ncbi:MAG: 30S ribosomal protein S17 [Phycisphaerales bacterium]|nr:MAG: 30S ribosomal protein S17 [Phycisphaerales bacterium]UCF15424.1 MAG: 30S ribosomal protein S17 [Phycisphaerales bacterium]
MQDSKVKTLTAAVVSKSGDKSVTVAIDYKVRHPKYGKYIRRRTKLAVHDEHNRSNVGDVVEIAQCRPRSKRKSWRLLKVVERVEQA